MHLYNKFRKSLPDRVMKTARKFYYFKIKTNKFIYKIV